MHQAAAAAAASAVPLCCPAAAAAGLLLSNACVMLQGVLVIEFESVSVAQSIQFVWPVGWRDV